VVYSVAILLKRLEVQHGQGHAWLWATQVVAGLREGRAEQDRVPICLCLTDCLCAAGGGRGMRVDPRDTMRTQRGEQMQREQSAGRQPAAGRL
jgi:hypothetical protein